MEKSAKFLIIKYHEAPEESSICNVNKSNLILLSVCTRQVMVGNADNAGFQPPNPLPYQANRINDKYLAELISWPQGKKKQSTIDKANKQLEGLVDLLKQEGVHVLRPEVVDWSKPVSTPFWSVNNQFSGTCPRDSLITCGNIIVEAALARRDRFFEFTAYRKAVETLWKTDK